MSCPRGWLTKLCDMRVLERSYVWWDIWTDIWTYVWTTSVITNSPFIRNTIKIWLKWCWSSCCQVFTDRPLMTSQTEKSTQMNQLCIKCDMIELKRSKVVAPMFVIQVWLQIFCFFFVCISAKGFILRHSNN